MKSETGTRYRPAPPP